MVGNIKNISVSIHDRLRNMARESSRPFNEFLQHFARELRPHEIREYLYTALHMQGHFRRLLTRHQPAFLARGKGG